MFLSSDARKVVSALYDFGIKIAMPDALYVEHAASLFFPNHVIGVVKSVLTGGNTLRKLERAQERGWQYFDKPVTDYLTKRSPAHRRPRPWPGLSSQADTVWRTVQHRLLQHDMNRDEADLLLYEVPKLHTAGGKLEEAIVICRDRDARTVAYLVGIMRRNVQKKGTQARERSIREVDPWEPPQDWTPIGPSGRARLEVEWDEATRNAALERELRDFGQSH